MGGYVNAQTQDPQLQVRAPVRAASCTAVIAMRKLLQKGHRLGCFGKGELKSDPWLEVERWMN